MAEGPPHKGQSARSVKRRFCPGCGCSVESDDRKFCPTCGAVLRFVQDGTPHISVHGVNAGEVEAVAQALFAKAPATRASRKQFPLVAAAFFLILFIVVFGAILTAARLVPVYVFPLALIAGILMFSVVGAFILREDASLSEKNFLVLMRLSFKCVPLLRHRGKQRGEK